MNPTLNFYSLSTRRTEQRKNLQMQIPRQRVAALAPVRMLLGLMTR
jgi:hypothetical protein